MKNINIILLDNPRRNNIQRIAEIISDNDEASLFFIPDLINGNKIHNLREKGETMNIQKISSWATIKEIEHEKGRYNDILSLILIHENLCFEDYSLKISIDNIQDLVNSTESMLLPLQELKGRVIERLTKQGWNITIWHDFNDFQSLNQKIADSSISNILQSRRLLTTTHMYYHAKKYIDNRLPNKRKMIPGISIW
ncbi:MAG: hypothetical protein INQ03_16095 [Candidatus Heimdallarchaeota archaeon]|nr:hypothetical protein [Candidatus Heimdallarchaeota archaeon]